MAEIEARLQAMRARFAARLIDERAAMHEMAASGTRTQEALAIVHRLAGTAGTLGFPAVSRTAGELEAALLAQAPFTPALVEWHALDAAIERAVIDSC